MKGGTLKVVKGSVLKELGKIKEHYDFSFDARQMGLVLFGFVAAAALAFALGMSVGVQWERKNAGKAAPAAAPMANLSTAKPAAPVAPPVLSPVTTAAPVPEKGDVDSTKPDTKADGQKKPEKTDVDLTFPKVLKSDSKGPQPLELDKKNKAQADGYTIQVEAFDRLDAAKSRVDKLKKKGYQARVFVADKKEVYRYKVQVGRYESREKAAPVLKKLKENEKVSPYLVKE